MKGWKKIRAAKDILRRMSKLLATVLRNEPGRRSKKINMVPVTSSALAGAGYDARSKTLYIRFCQGALYAYSNVPKSVYNELMAAPSKGRYFIANIREAYAYKRMD